MDAGMTMPISYLLECIKELSNDGVISETEIKTIFQSYNNVPDLLPQDVKDYLKHYPNTHYSETFRSYCVHIVCCEECGNTHYLTVYIDGTYVVHDCRGNEITIRDFKNFPSHKITNLKELREALHFYENQPY